MRHFLQRLTTSKMLRVGAKIGLTALVLWLVCRNLDMANVSDILYRQQHKRLMEVAGLLLAQIAVGAFRWQLILVALQEGVRPFRALQALGIYYISVFFNCCLPGTVGGDVVRVWLTRSSHVALPVAIHSVIIDRIITLAALGVMIVLALPLLSQAMGFSMPPVIAVLAVAAGLGMWLLYNVNRLLKPYRHVRLVHWLLYFIDSLRILLCHKAVSVLSLVYAMAGHVAYCLAGYVLARSLGIHLSALQAVVLIPPVMLAAVLPVSIGGWGLREAGMVGMLGLAGVAKPLALLLSVQMGLIGMLITLPAGALWLIRRKKSSGAD
jgi:uncharacterized membrane protein YbhN (UPF0104 family)